MKRFISLLTTALTCIGMCSLPVNAVYDLPAKETITLTSFEEVRDYFISEDAELSDGKVFYPNNYKIDFVETENNYRIILYGFEDVSEISRIFSQANANGHIFYSYPEYHSGMSTGYSSEYVILDVPKNITVYYFVNDTLTDFMYENISSLEAAKHYNFDVIPYVYPNLIPGDADCDGLISADDASMVLSAYSMQSTGEDLILNSTIFDYNNDGLVDADDASEVLSKYSEFSTT